MSFNEGADRRLHEACGRVGSRGVRPLPLPCYPHTFPFVFVSKVGVDFENTVGVPRSHSVLPKVLLPVLLKRSAPMLSY
jgi:hypothetical protein